MCGARHDRQMFGCPVSCHQAFADSFRHPNAARGAADVEPGGLSVDAASGVPPLHGLVLNAGTVSPSFRTTADGLEMTLQVWRGGVTREAKPTIATCALPPAPHPPSSVCLVPRCASPYPTAGQPPEPPASDDSLAAGAGTRSAVARRGRQLLARRALRPGGAAALQRQHVPAAGPRRVRDEQAVQRALRQGVGAPRTAGRAKLRRAPWARVDAAGREPRGRLGRALRADGHEGLLGGAEPSVRGARHEGQAVARAHASLVLRRRQWVAHGGQHSQREPQQAPLVIEQQPSFTFTPPAQLRPPACAPPHR